MAGLSTRGNGVIAAFLTFACSSGLTHIPRGQHPLSGGAQPAAVDSAPPPARIDTIAESPGNHCSWADGSWRWTDNRWQWQPGAWVQVPSDCYYADSLIVWVPSLGGAGVLFYTHGQWYSRAGGTCDEPATC